MKADRIKKEKLYLIGMMLDAILVLGTAGAVELGGITLLEACWQIAWAVGGCLIFFYLLWLEETRAARVVHRSRWTW